MLKIKEAVMQPYIDHLKIGYHLMYEREHPEYADLIGRVAQTVIDRISRSDAAYHDVEHTLLVALAGQAILQGRQKCCGNVTSQDWLNCMVSLLCHDVGYVKGACRQDQPEADCYVTGKGKNLKVLASNSTDAALTEHHVDRSKIFVRETFSTWPDFDLETIQRNIELTRFPVPNDAEHQDTINYPGLVRAADLIGQLADPRYLEKLPALFQEFEENGTNKVLGYSHPQELRANYPSFFWNVVHGYVKSSFLYLEQTRAGKQILANLFANVFLVERELQQVSTPSLAVVG
ncbi:MAG: metal-dependent phosphohydrolase [Jaaginema sp. PMC 1079.18]|nr:metal-dependent phosphohydrolase [Jaaginema sp. PMC 1080.18]MEC4852468.1 metal-dependent phosphohydrolase [Jaaginema sp. PMC 1079.18]MEC4864754.1 metal-dependent phosphohydrolase [Jaaginema sp. PMC 1078.18]